MFRTSTACISLVLFLATSCVSEPTIAELYRQSREERAEFDDPAQDTRSERARSSRIRRTRAILVQREEELNVEEKLYAAALLLDSSDSGDLAVAALLAEDAAKVDVRGLPLLAEAIDRQLMLQGLPQKYGTQYVWIPVTQAWELYRVDPSTSDIERSSLGVPTLAEAEARAEALNAKVE